MKSYILHRVVSLVLVLLLWGTGIKLGTSDPVEWRLILLTTVILGFTHYVVGGFYQLKSICRNEYAPKLLWWFAGLSLGSLVCYWAFRYFDWLPILSIVMIFYFLLHGYFNEVTLFERQTSLAARPVYVAVAILFLLGVTCLSVGHASWLFNESYEYSSFLMLSERIPVMVVLGISSLGASLLTLLWCIWASPGRRLVLAVTWVGVLLLSVGAVLASPVNYVLILSGLLSYHFIVWFLFYAEQFWRGSKKDFMRYIALHAVVLLPLSTVYFGASPGNVLVHGSIFLPFTLLHISTSFISEKWFHRIFIR